MKNSLIVALVLSLCGNLAIANTDSTHSLAQRDDDLIDLIMKKELTLNQQWERLTEFQQQVIATQQALEGAEQSTYNRKTALKVSAAGLLVSAAVGGAAIFVAKTFAGMGPEFETKTRIIWRSLMTVSFSTMAAIASGAGVVISGTMLYLSVETAHKLQAQLSKLNHATQLMLKEIETSRGELCLLRLKINLPCTTHPTGDL